VFIGSFNFDPRSALLNTELGLVIDSQKAAEHVAGSAEKAMDPSNSHRLSLRHDGNESKIVWSSRTERGEFVTDTEPNTSWWQRRWLDFLMALPIEEHL
jgi:putative cardiolipin synthase